MFYLMIHLVHFVYGYYYGLDCMIKFHSLNEKERKAAATNSLATLSIKSK